MKRIFSLICLTILVTSSIFAQNNKNEEKTNRISIGAIWYSDCIKTGGGAELGFTILDKSILIRDYINLNGYGGKIAQSTNNFGEVSIGNKIQIGSTAFEKDRLKINLYGTLSGEIGFYSTRDKSFFNLPLTYDLKICGGVELLMNSYNSVYTEFGGGVQFQQSVLGFSNLSLGYRYYF